MTRDNSAGFTLVELVMVIALLAIIVGVAVPVFQNMTTRARLAATKGLLGEIRAAIAIYRSSALAAGNSGAFSGFPTIGQVCDQSDNGVGVCIGTLDPKVMVNGILPNNPFAGKSGATHFTNSSFYNNVGDGNLRTAGSVPLTSGSGLNVAWWYKRTTGQFWPNTSSAPGEYAL